MLNPVIEEFEKIEREHGKMDNQNLKWFYENKSPKERVELIRYEKMNAILTTEMIEYLFKNGAIYYGNCDILYHVPEELITLSLAKTAVSTYGKSYSYLPLKFQKMPEIQNICVDHNDISLIPDDILLDETIVYGLKKDGLNIGRIPKTRRTKEFYEMAVLNKPNALRFMPDEYKTYEICKNAVIRLPKMLTCVPTNILTQKFIDDITSCRVEIPASAAGYVKACLENQKKEDNETVAPIKVNETAEEVLNIKIDDLKELLTLKAIKLLNKYSIYTLKELIAVVDNPTLCMEYFGDTKYYNEIVNTTRILKCKYLDIDPVINTNDEQECSKEFFDLMGLRLLSRYIINFYRGKSIKEFFHSMKELDIEKRLMQLPDVGKNMAALLVAKANVIMNYYEKHPENIPSIDDNVAINVDYEDIVKEYQTLKEERERLDQQIVLVSAKIEEMERQMKRGKSK